MIDECELAGVGISYVSLEESLHAELLRVKQQDYHFEAGGQPFST